jgi:DNA-binding NarL/FixJ family response regulator
MMGESRHPLIVLLVEGEALVRAGLRALLEREPWLRVAGEAGRAADAVRLFADLRPDVAIVSNDLRGESGLELIPRLLAVCPRTRVVALLASHDPEIHLMATRAGAHTTLTKHESPAHLLRALAPARTMSQPAASEASENGAKLSKREREVSDLVAAGLKNQQIAERLFISEGTVRRHLTSIFAKTGASSRTQLVILMRDRGR